MANDTSNDSELDVREIFAPLTNIQMSEDEALDVLERFFVTLVKILGAAWDIPVHQLRTTYVQLAMPHLLTWTLKVERTTQEEYDYEIIFIFVVDGEGNIIGGTINLHPWDAQSDFHTFDLLGDFGDFQSDLPWPPF